ncbi:ATP-binding cassette domain-containing protein [Clostridium carnis]
MCFMKNQVININSLNKKINDNVILDNINLDIERGLIYGIIGSNGSGKSMLFKSICGLIKPTNGEIFVLDKKIHNGELAEDIGVLIEKPGFLPQYSGFDNLKILSSINNKIDDKEIEKFISLVGLSSQDKRPIRKYSLGMKQRLGIAQALMEKPKILILDEPMNGLDEDGVSLIRNILLDLKKDKVTILISSHNKDDIEVLCDKVYKITAGKISVY